MENPINWAILCPGPSLNVEMPWRYDYGGLVAVNGAILKCHANYWSVLDPAVFAACYRSSIKFSTYAVIWTHLNFDQLGSTLRDPQTNESIWDPPTREAYRNWIKRIYFSNLPAEMPFGKDILWNEYSFFAAIALAVLKGAQHIRVYGADMNGCGYFLPGLENYKTKHTEKRWTYERVQFTRIVCACGEHGIIVERIGSGSYA